MLSRSAARTVSRKVNSIIAGRLDEIASAIWQVEPTPKAVLDYLETLAVGEPAEIGPDYPLRAMEKFSTRLEDYGRRFSVLKASRGRRADLEFLYTAKISYELGMDRKLASLLERQEQMFGSRPGKDVLKRLRLWVYTAGGQISLHDIARQSIMLSDRKVRHVLSSISFAVQQGNLAGSSDENAFLTGAFIGRNCHAARTADFVSLLPGNPTNNNMRSQRFYEIALGHEIGKRIMLLRSGARKAVFHAANTSVQFGRNLGEGIGWSVTQLSPRVSRQTMGYAKRIPA